MEQLPEVLRFVISKAATSGKELSWSVWNSGDTTTVKLFWKPEALLSRSSPLGQPSLPSATNNAITKPKKKKRSPSSKKRSNQRLRNFLEKKRGQFEGVKTTVVQDPSGTLNGTHLPSSLVEDAKAAMLTTAQTVTDVEKDVQTTDSVQESPGTQNGAHLPSSLSEGALVEGPTATAAQQIADNSQTVSGVESPTPLSTPVCQEKLESRDSGSPLMELLEGAENIAYEARDDTTGISFVKNGKREWVPVVVTKRGGEMSAADLKRCKRIVYFEEEDNPYFSIRQGKFQFPTPIAKRTRSHLCSSRQLI